MVNLQNVIGIQTIYIKKTDRRIKEHPENRRKWLYGNLVLRRKNREGE
jgi:hypothetical protein